MLFLKVISEKLLTYRQRNPVPLTRSQNGYQTMSRPSGAFVYNYCKRRLILFWISYWVEEGLSYPSYQRNNAEIKLNEDIVYAQIVEHLKTRQVVWNTSICLQTTSHRSDTAPFHVKRDLIRAVDTDGGAILTLLQVSDAFDTTNHQIFKFVQSVLWDTRCASTSLTLKYGMLCLALFCLICTQILFEI